MWRGTEGETPFRTSLPISASSQAPRPILPISLLHGPMGECGEGGPGCGLEGSGSARLCPGPKEGLTARGQGHVEQRWSEPSGPSQEGPEVPHRTRQEILHRPRVCLCLQMCPDGRRGQCAELYYLPVHTCAHAHTRVAMTWLCSDQLWANDLRPVSPFVQWGTVGLQTVPTSQQRCEGRRQPSCARSTGLSSGMSTQVLLCIVFTQW